GVEVAAAVPLQRARGIRGIGESRQVGHGLLEGGHKSHGSLQSPGKGVAFKAGIEIVVLRRPMVDAEARAEDGLPVKRVRRPSNTDARIKIQIVGVVQRGVARTWRRIYWSDAQRNVSRMGAEAYAMELIEVKYGRGVVRLVGDSIVFPAEAGTQSERRRSLPFILEIRHVESAAILVAAPGRGEIYLIDLAIQYVRQIVEAERVACGLALIQTDAADLHARLEGVPAVDPGQVIDHSVSRSHFFVRLVVVDRLEIQHVHLVGNHARLRIVEGRAINVDLRFIHHIGRKNVLHRDEIIRRMINGSQKIEQVALWTVNKADVALGAAVESGLFADLVVDAHEPAVFT